MNGAESLVHTLLRSGITTCFANPGTSEMHFVAALDRVPGLRCVLCLAETVVTGAADGYGRMAADPAVTLLHCAPGMANGLSNLHNARRARTPIVNVVGDHATDHKPLDPVLAGDTDGWARGVSAWTRTASSAAGIGQDVAEAIQAARGNRIATLIAPADTCWNEGGVVAERLAVSPPAPVAPHLVDEMARLLRGSEAVTIVVGHTALLPAALADAWRIAQATGARLLAHQFNARVQRGQGRYPIERLAYGIDQAMAQLAGAKHVVLVGAPPTIAPFAYPGRPNRLTPADATLHVFGHVEQDLPGALAALAEALSTPRVACPAVKRPEGIAQGRLTPESVTQTLACLLPENAVVVDESVSFGRAFFNGLAGAAPHDWLQITGGAIGTGFPMATGAAMAVPDRRVVALQADGAGMYSLQALWTQARENLPVTTVVFSNRKYAILLGELANVGANPGPVALSMMDLSRPDLDWVSLSRGMGVEAARAETMEEFAQLFTTANASADPFLIELVV